MKPQSALTGGLRVRNPVRDMFSPHRSSRSLILRGFIAMLAPAQLFAHASGEHGMLAGLLHPLHGLDHLLAMLAVGLLGLRLAGSAEQWDAQPLDGSFGLRVAVLPLAFLGGLFAGSLAGLQGIVLPGVEFAIVLSVIVAGLALVAGPALHDRLVAFGGRDVTLAFVAPAVGLFAVYHGVAHGLEFTGSEQVVPGYIIGMLLSSTLLHALGALLAYFALRSQASMVLRLSGAALVLSGVTMLLPF